MALRKRSRERQLEAFVVASELPNSPGHPSYTAPNRLLAKNGFDHQLVEKLCTPYYAETTVRPGVPPGAACCLVGPEQVAAVGHQGGSQ
jgi:hypothetical protein